LQYWHYLGGLDGIRGFVDNRFAGRYFLQSNTELRMPVLRTSSLVVQASVFSDVVATGEQIEDLNKVRGASIGGGLRMIFPKVYRAVIRLDFANPIVANDESPISFGVQQFF
jgi:hemolysin activation/secretion protein